MKSVRSTHPHRTATLASLGLLLSLGSSPTMAGLWLWGSNNTGQLGDGTREDRSVPVAVELVVQSAPRVAAACTTEQSTLALDVLGRVFAWGLRFGSQTSIQNVPERVDFPGLEPSTPISQIAASDSHGMALTQTGRLFTWGENSDGQLGDGTNVSREAPAELAWRPPDPANRVAFIAAGEDHSLAILRNRQLYAWGRNQAGQLGDGSRETRRLPVLVQGTPEFASQMVNEVSGGLRHSVAVTSTGQVFAWGDNSSGQLGNNSTTPSTLPLAVNYQAVAGNSPAIHVAAAGSHSLILTSEGSVYGWGDNAEGQVTGPDDAVLTPRKIDLVDPLNRPVRITAISTSKLTSLALAEDGTVFAWGAWVGNGDGSEVFHREPIRLGSDAFPPGVRITGLARSTSAYHVSLISEREVHLGISVANGSVAVQITGQPLSAFVLEQSEEISSQGPGSWIETNRLTTDANGNVTLNFPTVNAGFWRSRRVEP